MPQIHPTAVVSPEAVFADDVRIGAFAVIEGPVTIGPGCVIGPHAHIIGPVTMGANNQVGTGVVIGSPPQHRAYRGEPTAVEIGDENIFREHVTVHRGMPVGVGSATGVTRIGHRNLFMVNSHVGHDCVVGNDCTLVNGALLGGHVVLEDRVLLSGNCAVHQFCRVGRLALVSGTSGVSKDVPPFWIQWQMNQVRGINMVGMRRAGMSTADITAVRKAFRTIYLARPALLLREALRQIEAEWGHVAAIRELLTFIRSSKRGICGAHRFVRSSADDDSAAAA
ncbi:MAG: acyl-ACP--UDP-N-acetylglucosamine O-acyltransferase [Gemmataceae bacterium]|nr:acyl-ACP--UDP-N-acetylglucosamine O-acyltransferase [Gemmata sp.]MDW8196624.1 acyl-ACP--UDP-N-acetylglucosamine O-acyltransferase [Gemmataceae bacterium]